MEDCPNLETLKTKVFWNKISKHLGQNFMSQQWSQWKQVFDTKLLLCMGLLVVGFIRIIPTHQQIKYMNKDFYFILEVNFIFLIFI